MTGFDDLNRAGKEQAADDESAADGADGESDGADGVERDDGSGGGSDDGSSAESDERGDEPREESAPAFPFDEAVQAQIYPRESTHAEFEDFLDIDVKRLLRDRGVRDEEGRELHEAVLRVAMEHPEEIADELAAQRRE